MSHPHGKRRVPPRAPNASTAARTLTLLLAVLSFTAAAPAEVHELKVMSFNILRNGMWENPPCLAWDFAPNPRRDLATQVIADIDADIFGVQEAAPNQVTDILTALPQYDAVAFGSADGGNNGVFNALYYRTARFTLLDSGAFWHSETPDTPGTNWPETNCTGWDDWFRFSTWAKLRDNTASRDYFVLNTHLNSLDSVCRSQSIPLIRDKLAEIAGDLPILLMGDLNMWEDDFLFDDLLGSGGGVPLIDSYRALHADDGQERTAHGCSGNTSGNRIDFILHSDFFTVIDATIDRTQYGNDWPSDHFPITATYDVPGLNLADYYPSLVFISGADLSLWRTIVPPTPVLTPAPLPSIPAASASIDYDARTDRLLITDTAAGEFWMASRDGSSAFAAITGLTSPVDVAGKKNPQPYVSQTNSTPLIEQENPDPLIALSGGVIAAASPCDGTVAGCSFLAADEAAYTGFAYGAALDADAGVLFMTRATGVDGEGTIDWIDLVGQKNPQPMITGLNYPADVVMVKNPQPMILWTDVNDGTVMRADVAYVGATVTATNVTAVIPALPDFTPAWLAVDADAGRFYMTEHFNDAVWRADLDGGNLTMIYCAQSFILPTGIAFTKNPNPFLVFAENVTGNVQRLNLTAAGNALGLPQTLMTVTAPNGVAIDAARDRLWVADRAQGEGLLWQSGLDGANPFIAVNQLGDVSDVVQGKNPNPFLVDTTAPGVSAGVIRSIGGCDGTVAGCSYLPDTQATNLGSITAIARDDDRGVAFVADAAGTISSVDLVKKKDPNPMITGQPGVTDLVMHKNPDPFVGKKDPNPFVGQKDPNPYIAWTNAGAGTVTLATLAYGSPPIVTDVVTLVPTGVISSPTGITADAAGRRLFITDPPAGKIWQFDLAGGVLTELASGLPQPGLIAYVYGQPACRAYVDADAAGANDGTSWTDAFNRLADAMTPPPGCLNNYEIWIAEGTYFPDGGYTPVGGSLVPGSGDRDATFALGEGVKVYGGFDGTERFFDERDPDEHATVLSGDVGVAGFDCSGDPNPCFNAGGVCADGWCVLPGAALDNSYHVVTCIDAGSEAVLDGVTVTAGNADGAPNDDGAGMLVDNAAPQVTDCVFSNHTTPGDGGAIKLYGTTAPVVITGCRFDSNTARRGGAVDFAQTAGGVTWIDCAFANNTSTSSHGGAIYGGTGSVGTAVSCTFAANTSGGHGGAISTSEEMTVINSLLVGNSALSPPFNHGGAIDTNGATLDLINSAVLDNTAGNLGGGVYVSFSSVVNVSNSILRGNVADSDGTTGGPFTDADAQVGGAGAPTVNHSNVQGGFGSGTGNIDANPLFVADPDDGGDGWGVGGNDDFGDLHLSSGSPCLDAGDNAAVPSEVTRDADNNARILNGTVDMGIYEATDCDGNGVPDQFDADGDEDGVPDGCDDCPGTIPDVTVDMHGCPHVIPFDDDRDGDVDPNDFGQFQLCISGPNLPLTPGCEAFDIDGDNDVDLTDYGHFQVCLSGANLPADPDCGQ